MRVAIIGAGAMGGAIGGRLAASGVEVAFLARGRQLWALRRDGLSVRHEGRTLHLPRPVAAAEPASIGPADVVLLCVKAYDLQGALGLLAPLRAPGGLVLTLQNGIAAPGLAAQAVGAGAVLAGVSWFAARLAGPAQVEVAGGMQGRPWLEFAALAGAPGPAAGALVQALDAAGVPAALVPDAGQLLWEKFCLICATSSSAALTRLPIGTVRADPESRWLIVRAIAEAAAVARAGGVDLPDDTEARTLALIDSMPAAARPSQLTDLEAGKPLELDWLSGEVCRRGAAAGLDTPYHRVVCAALRPYADGRPAKTGA